MALPSSLTLFACVTLVFVPMSAMADVSNFLVFDKAGCNFPQSAYFVYTPEPKDPMQCTTVKKDGKDVSLQWDCSSGLRAVYWDAPGCSGTATGSICFDAVPASGFTNNGCVDGTNNAGDISSAHVSQWGTAATTLLCAAGGNSTGNTTGSGRRLAACPLPAGTAAKGTTSKSAAAHSLFVMLSVMAVGSMKLLVEV